MALVIVRLYIAQSEATAEAVARAAQDARFRSMVHRSADAMLVMDADGTLQYATPSFAEMLGQAPETELSGPVHALPGMSSFPPALTPSGPTPFRWKLGHGAHQRDVEVLVTDLRQDPAVHGYVLNLRDVTERHRLEEQLRQSQKLEVAGRLAASVAHDFNNILMVVLGNARLAAVRPHGAHADEWAAVGAAAERGAALARQLLAIGKPTPLQPSVVDVAVCLGSMSRTLEAVLPTSVECRIEVQQVRMPVFIDPVQVEQVILNLALNARDAMPSGGRLDINASLTVEARPRLRIDVRDSGSGMSDEVRSLAFEPFFTTKADGLGTGLGLSTVRGIVTDRGGEVSLASTPGQGTTVSVFLPLTPEVEAVVDAGAFPTQAARAARLLVVDDEPAVRDVLRRLLSLHGYEVMVASDGAEALRLLGSSATGVDLVLTDLVMPRMGGESLAREIRTHYPTVAVLCMSGTPSVIAGDDVPWSSANLLTKPIDPEALVLRVSEALTARESVAATG